MTPSSGAAITAVLILALALAGVITVTIFFLVRARNERAVRAASVALVALEALNPRFQSALVQYPPIRLNFNATASTKAQFDRFDLNSYLSVCVLQHEAWVANEIRAREAVAHNAAAYFHEYALIGHLRIRQSDTGHLDAARFKAIEARLFQRGALRAPTASAQVVATVRYVSPKGQNRYSRRLEWDYSQLRYGLHAGQQDRARKSTTAYLRQRERSLMTPKLRADVMRRDNYRCRMCGASRHDGVRLHVDHIVPVSHDGRTVPENLQTLCEACNLGKGNRFVG